MLQISKIHILEWEKDKKANKTKGEQVVKYC